MFCIIDDPFPYHHYKPIVFVRREQLQEALKDTSTSPISITVFPRIGCPGFTLPEHTPNTTDSASNSLFFPDEAIWRSHPRYRLGLCVAVDGAGFMSPGLCGGIYLEHLLAIFVRGEERNRPSTFQVSKRFCSALS